MCQLRLYQSTFLFMFDIYYISSSVNSFIFAFLQTDLFGVIFFNFLFSFIKFNVYIILEFMTDIYSTDIVQFVIHSNALKKKI